MKDGVYFNMHESVYHGLKRLSSSGIKDLLQSPAEFWFNSNFNPLKKEAKSEAMEDGKIFHSLILEDFEEKYSTMPKEIDELNKNSNVFKMWRDCQTRAIISYKKRFEFEKIINYLKTEGQVLGASIFAGGYSEVSILWTEGGIARKARIDYLTASRLIDLKTFVKINKDGIGQYIKKYFFGNSVFTQLMYYEKALKYAIENFKLEEIHGTAEQKEFWSTVIPNISQMVVFVNRKTPQGLIKIFDEQACQDVWRLGLQRIKKAEELYLEYMESHGEKKAWLQDLDLDDLYFKDEDFPQAYYELLGGGYE